MADDREQHEVNVPDALTGGATPIPRIVASQDGLCYRGQTPVAKFIPKFVATTDERGATPIPRVPPPPPPEPTSPPQK
jgi:hypothetical protein